MDNIKNLGTDRATLVMKFEHEVVVQFVKIDRIAWKGAQRRLLSIIENAYGISADLPAATFLREMNKKCSGEVIRRFLIDLDNSVEGSETSRPVLLAERDGGMPTRYSFSRTGDGALQLDTRWEDGIRPAYNHPVTGMSQMMKHGKMVLTTSLMRATEDEEAPALRLEKLRNPDRWELVFDTIQPYSRPVSCTTLFDLGDYRLNVIMHPESITLRLSDNSLKMQHSVPYEHPPRLREKITEVFHPMCVAHMIAFAGNEKLQREIWDEAVALAKPFNLTPRVVIPQPKALPASVSVSVDKNVVKLNAPSRPRGTNTQGNEELPLADVVTLDSFRKFKPQPQ